MRWERFACRRERILNRSANGCALRPDDPWVVQNTVPGERVAGEKRVLRTRDEIDLCVIELFGAQRQVVSDLVRTADDYPRFPRVSCGIS